MVRNPSDHQSSRAERPSVSHASGGPSPISPFAAYAPVAAPPVPAPPTVSSPFVNLECPEAISLDDADTESLAASAVCEALGFFGGRGLERLFPSLHCCQGGATRTEFGPTLSC